MRGKRTEIRRYFSGSIYSESFIHKGLLTRNCGTQRLVPCWTLRTRSERTVFPASGFPTAIRPPSHPTEFPCHSATAPWIQRVANRGRQRRVKAPGTRRKPHGRSPSHPCMPTEGRGRNPKLSIHTINDAHPCFGFFPRHRVTSCLAETAGCGLCENRPISRDTGFVTRRTSSRGPSRLSMAPRAY